MNNTSPAETKQLSAIHLHDTKDPPVLWLHPYVVAKIKMAWKRETEIGGFGILDASAEYPFYVTDWKIVKQEATAAHIDFDDVAYAKYISDMADAGVPFTHCGCCHIHTHPSGCMGPSGTDENECYSKYNYEFALFLIAPKGAPIDKWYCRLKCVWGKVHGRNGPVLRHEQIIAVRVWEPAEEAAWPRIAADLPVWKEEFDTLVIPKTYRSHTSSPTTSPSTIPLLDGLFDPDHRQIPLNTLPRGSFTIINSNLQTRNGKAARIIQFDASKAVTYQCRNNNNEWVDIDPRHINWRSASAQTASRTLTRLANKQSHRMTRNIHGVLCALNSDIFNSLTEAEQNAVTGGGEPLIDDEGRPIDHADLGFYRKSPSGKLILNALLV